MLQLANQLQQKPIIPAEFLRAAHGIAGSHAGRRRRMRSHAEIHRVRIAGRIAAHHLRTRSVLSARPTALHLGHPRSQRDRNQSAPQALVSCFQIFAAECCHPERSEGFFWWWPIKSSFGLSGFRNESGNSVLLSLARIMNAASLKAHNFPLSIALVVNARVAILTADITGPVCPLQVGA